MRVAIATVQVPFIRGGAEVMTAGLELALRRSGHDVEIVTMPFRFSPPEFVSKNMDAWASLNFGAFDCGSIDHVIALKFPAFYLSHPNKSVWLMHQHRSVYELFDTEFGESSANASAQALREKVVELDRSSLVSSKAVFTISRTVSERLKKYNDIDSSPLYQPPPQAEAYLAGDAYPYVFFPSRLESLKRQDLLIRAMQYVPSPVFAVIAGEGGRYHEYVQLINHLGLNNRVKLVGRVDDQTMRRYYSNALAVFFGPYAEDYGFITLEAMLSAKPVISCHDSGGPTEFVVNGETGFVTDPDPVAVADAINFIWSNRNKAKEMGFNGLVRYRALGISWNNVVQMLLGDA